MSKALEPQLSRDRLQALVMEGRSVADVAGRLGCTTQAVRRAIKLFGLPQPIEVRRRLVDVALRAGERSLTRDCRHHGSTEFAIVGSERRLHCKKCRAEAVGRRRRRVKEQLVREAGGRCVICGYDRSVVALAFHHPDPSLKEFGVAQGGVTRAIDQVRREAQKCVLLCANCHAEVEWGVTRLPEAIVPR